MSMKFFLDEHQREFDSFPPEPVSDREFTEMYKAFESACETQGVMPLGAHVNCGQGRAYCLVAAPSEDAVRQAHEQVGFTYNKITEIRRVTSMDMLLNAPPPPGEA